MLDPDFANPYAAPMADLTAAPAHSTMDLAEAEATRRRYLYHEASVKSVSSLYYLGAVFGMLVTAGIVAFGVMAASGMIPNAAASPPMVMIFVIGGFYLAITLLNFAVGRGLHRLQDWARWTVIVLSALGLLLMLFVGLVLMIRRPVVGGLVLAIGGSIIGYILYLMASPNGAMVFSPGYKEVIALTPHVKNQTSLLVKVLLVLVVVGIIVAIVAAFSR